MFLVIDRPIRPSNISACRSSGGAAARHGCHTLQEGERQYEAGCPEYSHRGSRRFESSMAGTKLRRSSDATPNRIVEGSCSWRRRKSAGPDDSRLGGPLTTPGHGSNLPSRGSPQARPRRGRGGLRTLSFGKPGFELRSSFQLRPKFPIRRFLHAHASALSASRSQRLPAVPRAGLRGRLPEGGQDVHPGGHRAVDAARSAQHLAGARPPTARSRVPKLERPTRTLELCRLRDSHESGI